MASVLQLGKVSLGGRQFQLVNFEAITSLNEHYVMKLMRETGLDKKAAPLPDEEAAEARDQLLEIEKLVKRDGDRVPEHERAARLARAEGLRAQVHVAASIYMARLQSDVVDSLRAHELLAGYLLPVGKTEADFTTAMAADTARFLQGLQKAEDRAQVHQLTLGVALSFFEVGLNSLSDFLKSSASVSPKAEAASLTGAS